MEFCYITASIIIQGQIHEPGMGLWRMTKGNVVERISARFNNKRYRCQVTSMDLNKYVDRSPLSDSFAKNDYQRDYSTNISMINIFIEDTKSSNPSSIIRKIHQAAAMVNDVPFEQMEVKAINIAYYSSDGGVTMLENISDSSMERVISKYRVDTKTNTEQTND